MNFWHAVSSLVGTIIGVGMFGLPYAASQAGFIIEVLYIIVLFFIFVFLHLIFGEIILRTKDSYTLPGYANIYLNESIKFILILTTIFGTLGGMLVYILAGGNFLKLLSGDFISTIQIANLIFWGLMSALFLTNLKMIKKSETVMLIFMLTVLAILCVISVPKISIDNFKPIHLNEFFLPFGITLFSLAGSAAIPTIRNILQGSEIQMKKVIFVGTLIPAIFYIIFVSLVVGVSGIHTSEDAISGLQSILGDKIILLSAIFGVFAVITSYVIFAIYLKNTLVYDLRFKPFFASSIVLFVPIILVFMNFGSFIDIIGFLGAIFGSLEAIFLILTYKKSRIKSDRNPEYSLRVPDIVLDLLMTVFVLGIIYYILDLLTK